MGKEITFAVLGGLGAMLGWGASDFFAKKTIDKIGDIKTLFWAQLLGTIPLLIYCLIRFSLPVFSWNDFFILFLLSLLDGFGYIYFYKALSKGKVSVISPVLASYAALGLVISAIVFQERLFPVTLFLLLLIFLGILLTSVDLTLLKPQALDWRGLSRGLPEALVGVVLFGIWYPFWDDFISRGQWWILVFLLRIFISLIVFLVAKGDVLPKTGSDFSIWKLLLVIGFLDGGAYLALTWGFGVTSYTSVVTVLSAAYSLPTLILARIFLKEKLSFNQWFGVMLIIACLVALPLFG